MTGDEILLVNHKQKIGLVEFRDLLIDAIKERTKESIKGVFGGPVWFNEPPVLSAGADPDSVSIAAAKGTDGLGNLFDLSSAKFYGPDFWFPNANGTEYHIHVKMETIPNSVTRVAETGIPKYTSEIEVIGLKGTPDSVVEAGAGGYLELRVNTIIAAGGFANRQFFVYLVDPVTGIWSAAHDGSCQAVHDGSNWIIETDNAGFLGQPEDDFSTTASDYAVVMLGPVISTSKIEDAGYLYAGSVTGAGVGVSPDTFSTVDAPITYDLSDLANVLERGTNEDLKISVKSHADDSGTRQISVYDSNVEQFRFQIDEAGLVKRRNPDGNEIWVDSRNTSGNLNFDYREMRYPDGINRFLTFATGTTSGIPQPSVLFMGKRTAPEDSQIASMSIRPRGDGAIGVMLTNPPDGIGEISIDLDGTNGKVSGRTFSSDFGNTPTALLLEDKNTANPIPLTADGGETDLPVAPNGYKSILDSINGNADMLGDIFTTALVSGGELSWNAVIDSGFVVQISSAVVVANGKRRDVPAGSITLSALASARIYYDVSSGEWDSADLDSAAWRDHPDQISVGKWTFDAISSAYTYVDTRLPIARLEGKNDYTILVGAPGQVSGGDYIAHHRKRSHFQTIKEAFDAIQVISAGDEIGRSRWTVRVVGTTEMSSNTTWPSIGRVRLVGEPGASIAPTDDVRLIIPSGAKASIHDLEFDFTPHGVDYSIDPFIDMGGDSIEFRRCSFLNVELGGMLISTATANTALRKVSFRECEFDGINSDSNAYISIAGASASTATVEMIDCTVAGAVSGVLLYVNDQASNMKVRGLTIGESSSLEKVFHVVDCPWFDISGCNIELVSSSGIDNKALETAGDAHGSFSDSRVDSAFAGTGGIITIASDRVSISGVALSGIATGRRAVSVLGGNVRVDRCSFYGRFGHMIDFTGSGIISGNLMHSDTGTGCINVGNLSSDLAISNNLIAPIENLYTAYRGVFVGNNCERVAIRDNTIVGGRIAISATNGQTGLSIVGNVISDVDRNVINVYAATEVVIANNSIGDVGSEQVAATKVIHLWNCKNVAISGNVYKIDKSSTNYVHLTIETSDFVAVAGNVFGADTGTGTRDLLLGGNCSTFSGNVVVTGDVVEGTTKKNNVAVGNTMSGDTFNVLGNITLREAVIVANKVAVPSGDDSTVANNAGEI